MMSCRHHRIRRITVFALAALVSALLPALTACYEYVPLATSTPPVDQTVALQITDQGRVGLGDRFGPGLAEVVGRVASSQGTELVVTVFSVSRLNGESTQWAGETTRLDRSYIGSIKGRRFSKARTAIVAVGLAAVTGYLIYNHGLNGSFSGPTGTPDPGPGPASQRVPAGRFH